MNKPTQEQIEAALKRIEELDHYEMCRIWRFGTSDEGDILLRNDLPTGAAFKNRLFTHFGGYTPQISKAMIHNIAKKHGVLGESILHLKILNTLADGLTKSHDT